MTKPLMLLWLSLIITACNASTPLPPPPISPTLPPPTLATLELPPTATLIPYLEPTITPTPIFLQTLPETPPPVISQTQTSPLSPTVEIVAKALHLRQGAGLEYPTIGAVKQGQRFAVIAQNGDWLQVETPQGLGWLSAKPAYTRLLTPGQTSVPLKPTAALRATAPITPTATPTGLSGQLVFMNQSGGVLALIQADGTGYRHIAGAATHALMGGVIDPAVSPDGQWVAFTRWDGAEFGALYIIKRDGTGEQVILGDIRQPKAPTWSPDGQQIMLSFQHGGRRDPTEECHTFDPDDGMEIPDNAKITKIHQGEQGLTVCFIRFEDLQWALRLVQVATGQFEDFPVDNYAYTPTWHPTLAWQVIYQGQKGLRQLDVLQSSHLPITQDRKDTSPVFSPDGQKVAVTYQQGSNWDIHLIDLATGTRQRLTKPPILANPQPHSAAPAWSPDGQHLAFMTNRQGVWEIWVMKADGSQQRPMFPPELQATWHLSYAGMNERMLNWVK